MSQHKGRDGGLPCNTAGSCVARAAVQRGELGQSGTTALQAAGAPESAPCLLALASEPQREAAEHGNGEHERSPQSNVGRAIPGREP
jgi:hypothetical protein